MFPPLICLSLLSSGHVSPSHMSVNVVQWSCFPTHMSVGVVQWSCFPTHMSVGVVHQRLPSSIKLNCSMNTFASLSRVINSGPTHGKLAFEMCTFQMKHKY